jgi:hypothetical protein
MKWGFCGWSNHASAPNINAEDTYDFVPEITVPGRAKSKVVMYRRPGLEAFGTAGAGPHRASLEENGRAFVLSGTGFYEAFADGTFTLRGSVAFSSEPGTLHGNGTGGHQIFIVSGGLGYIFDTNTNVFAAISDPDFPADVAMGFYIKGHFGVVQRNTRTFAISAAFDGTSWSALDIGEKSGTVDYLIAGIVDQDQSELWLIGPRSMEVWWYSGAAGFPLEPIPNRIVPIGGGAAFSWIDIGGTVYGLGESKDGGHVVVRFQGGYTPERISTHALEHEIQGYAMVDDAQAFSTEWHGHRFFVLTFPSADTTHVYDEASGGWTHWSRWDTTTGERRSFLGHGHIFAFGKHLMGSRSDGQFYEFTDEVFADDGDPIRSERVAPYLGDGVHQFRHNRLLIDAETGVGLSTGQGSSPRVMVSWSDDGAQTWSDEQLVDLGAQGNYGHVAELRRLGLAGRKGRVYKLVVTDPVVVAITDVDCEAEAVA